MLEALSAVRSAMGRAVWVSEAMTPSVTAWIRTYLAPAASRHPNQTLVATLCEKTFGLFLMGWDVHISHSVVNLFGYGSSDEWGVAPPPEQFVEHTQRLALRFSVFDEGR